MRSLVLTYVVLFSSGSSASPSNGSSASVHIRNRASPNSQRCYSDKHCQFPGCEGGICDWHYNYCITSGNIQSGDATYCPCNIQDGTDNCRTCLYNWECHDNLCGGLKGKCCQDLQLCMSAGSCSDGDATFCPLSASSPSGSLPSGSSASSPSGSLPSGSSASSPSGSSASSPSGSLPSGSSASSPSGSSASSSSGSDGSSWSSSPSGSSASSPSGSDEYASGSSSSSSPSGSSAYLPSGSSTSSSGTNFGSIVGGSVGGVSFFGILICICKRMLCRKGGAASNEENAHSAESASSAAPSLGTGMVESVGKSIGSVGVQMVVQAL